MLTPGQQDTADALRYAGLALQLAGVGLAAYGIRNIRREWTNRLGIAATSARTLASVSRATWSRIRRCWRRLLRHPDPVELTSVGSSLTFKWNVDVALTIPDPPVDAPLEDRVGWLEQHLTATWAHAESTRQALIQEASKRTSALQAEQTARDAHAEQVRESIGRLAGGGLRLQTWGVVCLLAGIILATIPDKLAAI